MIGRWSVRVAWAGLAVAVCAQTTSELVKTNLPVQRIGPNDLLAVSVLEAPEFSRTLRVSPQGWIRLPMLDEPIPVAGMYPHEVETRLARALEEAGLLVNPVVTVTVVEYASRPVSVVGAVHRPLTFQADVPVTLLDAIARAGGLRPEAGPEILVVRKRTAPDGSPLEWIQRVPVKALMEGSKPEFNLTLTGGEEVRVPEAGKVYVVGNVKRPGAYPVQEPEGTSVLKLLALAEGLAPYASRFAYIYRVDPRTGSKYELPVALQDILDRKQPEVLLQPGDILYVPDNRSKRARVAVIEKLVGFGSATVSGVLIWGVAR